MAGDLPIRATLGGWLSLALAATLGCTPTDTGGAASAQDADTVARWRILRDGEVVGDVRLQRGADGAVVQETRVWVLDGQTTRLANLRTGWTPAPDTGGTLWRQGAEGTTVSIALPDEPRWGLARLRPGKALATPSAAIDQPSCPGTLRHGEARLGDALTLHTTTDWYVPLPAAWCLTLSLATEVADGQDVPTVSPGSFVAPPTWSTHHTGAVGLVDRRGLVLATDGAVVYARASTAIAVPTVATVRRAWVGDQQDPRVAPSAPRAIWEVRGSQEPCAGTAQRQSTQPVAGGWLVRVLREPRLASEAAESAAPSDARLPDNMRAHADIVRAAGATREERVDTAVAVVRRRLRAGRVLGTRPLATVWEAGEGDCTEYARATVALLTAAGVPSRVVVGWAGGSDGVIGWHAWVEYQDGGRWNTVDPTVGRRPAPVDRICLATGGEDLPAWFVPAARIQRSTDRAWSLARSPSGPSEDASR